MLQQTGVSATGPEHIRSAMGALNLKYTKVDLTNGYIDAQKSANNGVFVLVVGTLAPPDAADKPFVQTFLLSNQVCAMCCVALCCASLQCMHLRWRHVCVRFVVAEG